MRTTSGARLDGADQVAGGRYGEPVPESLPAALRAASIGEVAWVDPRDGALRVRGVLPLADDEGPVLAVPYAAADAARSLGAAGGALLVTRDDRSTAAAYRPLTLRCRPRLVEDRTGDRFVAELLGQELRRYPPSRVLADSVILRREQWWWLPRLLVHLEVEAVDAPLPREDERDHLLVVDTGGPDPVRRLAAASARLTTLPDPPGTDLPPLAVTAAPGPGPAVLHGQDASFPDLERWGRWHWRGRWDGAHLAVAEAPERVGLPPVPGVVARVRRQRALRKACLAGLDGSPAGPVSG